MKQFNTLSYSLCGHISVAIKINTPQAVIGTFVEWFLFFSSIWICTTITSMHIIHREDVPVRSTSVIVRLHGATMMEFVNVSAASPSKTYRYGYALSVYNMHWGNCSAYPYWWKEQKSLNGMCLWLPEECSFWLQQKYGHKVIRREY